jgi:hypothetical protein
MREFLSVLAFVWMASQMAAAREFINLGFEEADLPFVPEGKYGGIVSSEQALPGWTPAFRSRFGEGTTSKVVHNSISLGGAIVAIHGPSWSAAVGDYEVNLVAGEDELGEPILASIAQTGIVPDDAVQVSLYVNMGYSFVRLTLSGNNIPLIIIGEHRVVGDISAFAGQEVELKITAFPPGFHIIDDIRFSSDPLPDLPRPNVEISRSSLNGDPAVELSFDTREHVKYQLFKCIFHESLGYFLWETDGNPVPGDGERLSFKRKLGPSKTITYRNRLRHGDGSRSSSRHETYFF